MILLAGVDTSYAIDSNSHKAPQSLRIGDILQQMTPPPLIYIVLARSAFHCMGLLFRRRTVYVQRGHSRITLLLSYSDASAELTCSMTRVDYCRRAWCASDTGVIYGVIVSVPRRANAMMASMSVMSRRVYGAETVRLCDADGASRPPSKR